MATQWHTMCRVPARDRHGNPVEWRVMRLRMSSCYVTLCLSGSTQREWAAWRTAAEAIEHVERRRTESAKTITMGAVNV